ncbi:MAG: DPP IV N-terminal domain-containing protein [Acidobacteria bacterium]|nr:DPP IV N-terminal domain-containing protein [Acidobacteriota bacterium]
MKKLYPLALLFLLVSASAAPAKEARLIRYPHYHDGRVAFSYLGDVWVADEDGRNVQRLTVNRARDVYPRFSPDGKWLAFSSDRNGNLDVYLIPAAGGTVKQLTSHSADDTVLNWSPDGRSVLFSSNRGENFLPLLYTVSVDGGMPVSAGADSGVQASFSPDGRRLAYNQKSQAYWRKFYRGSYQSDVMVGDVAAKKFSSLTDFDGMDSWPMWARDGNIYFVSDRDGAGQTNIWRVPEAGGKAERVTSFKSGDVRWPAISADGRTIVFEHDFQIAKLDLGSKRVTPLRFDINAETGESLSEVRSFNSEVDDYDLAPNSRRVVVSVHGEVFTAPVEEGDLRQITDSPWRDRDVTYSPDGKWIAYVSDRSGREELYVSAVDGAGAPRKLTDLDALKTGYRWSPDSAQIAYAASDGKLRVLTVADGRSRELSTSRYGNIGTPAWSPDGKWLAYSKPDVSRTTDIYLTPAAGGEEKKVTFDSFSEAGPRFSPDGRKLYFLRNESTQTGQAAGQPAIHIYAVTLERLERDPDDPEERAEAEAAQAEQQTPPAGAGGEGGAPGGAMRRQAGAPRTPPRPVQIDWPGLKRRTRQLTRMPFPVTSFEVSPDGRSVVFTTFELAGQANVPVIYSVQEDGRRLTRITAGMPPQGGDGPGGPPQGGGGFGGGVSNLNISRDGRTLFFQEGDYVYSVALPPPAPPGAPAAASGASGGGPSGGAPRRRINFVAKVRVDRPAEWAEMFDDAWRTMKYRFYDPKMHGMDWDAMRAKYRPLVEYVGDRQELLNIVNEMIGELNASHTGAAPPPGGGREPNAVSTGHLGVELEPDAAAGRYRVTHIYENGPSDKDWVKVSVGDYLIAIDGKPVKVGDEYWALLNHRLNRKVAASFNSRPTPEGAWSTRIEPVSMNAFSQLRYERWVKERREMVDKLSGGRVGYVHIQAMNAPSLRKFEKELREYRHKEAMVIDQRWNGGGNIEQELLAILVQRQYQVWQPRGTEATTRPFAGFFGPKIVMQNWRSASNAEMFPAGFRALGLGKVVGTPTMGAVIGTGSYSLIDGSTVRTPGTGVYLFDKQLTNMENYGVRPDILVENTPEDTLAGRDRQLETAVQELLKELQGGARRLASGEEK